VDLMITSCPRSRPAAVNRARAYPCGLSSGTGQGGGTIQTWRARIILFIAAAFLAAGAARAQDISRGKEIAQIWCSDCHLVDPQERKSGRNSTPTFLSIARMKSTTEASLAAFLSTPHGRRGGMPDIFLNRDDIQDVSGYILSLRKPR
jgi:mono/diheme cytochrome c family protein